MHTEMNSREVNYGNTNKNKHKEAATNILYHQVPITCNRGCFVSSFKPTLFNMKGEHLWLCLQHLSTVWFFWSDQEVMAVAHFSTPANNLTRTCKGGYTLTVVPQMVKLGSSWIIQQQSTLSRASNVFMESTSLKTEVQTVRLIKWLQQRPDSIV